MKAKEYLSKAAYLKRRIKFVSDRIEEIREEMSSPKAIRYDKDMIQSSPSGDIIVNYMIKLEKEEARLTRLREEYLEKRIEISQRILDVTPGLYSDILYMRYLEEKSLAVISEELNYSYEWTCRLHGRALIEFSRRHPDI